jgi:hypothetical protein
MTNALKYQWLGGDRRAKPCLHVEVPAFAETFRVGMRLNTQAWSSA